MKETKRQKLANEIVDSFVGMETKDALDILYKAYILTKEKSKVNSSGGQIK